METKKVKPQASESGRGGWAVVILLNALIVIGLLAYGRRAEGWGPGIPFVRNAFSGNNSDPDNGDRASSPILSLPDVVVGLQADGANLYVDAAFDLEVASEEDREAVRKQLSRVRDETIGFLSELSPAELRGSGPLAKTKARLLERFRNVMPSQRLRALYVTYLAVARDE